MSEETWTNLKSPTLLKRDCMNCAFNEFGKSDSLPYACVQCMNNKSKYNVRVKYETERKNCAQCPNSKWKWNKNESVYFFS